MIPNKGILVRKRDIRLSLGLWPESCISFIGHLQKGQHVPIRLADYDHSPRFSPGHNGIATHTSSNLSHTPKPTKRWGKLEFPLSKSLKGGQNRANLKFPPSRRESKSIKPQFAPRTFIFPPKKENWSGNP